jgi:hypothetical protein
MDSSVVVECCVTGSHACGPHTAARAGNKHNEIPKSRAVRGAARALLSQ